jgi:hypothetical protein
MGCGFGEGRASGLEVSCECERNGFRSNTDLQGEPKAALREKTTSKTDARDDAHESSRNWTRGPLPRDLP